MRITKPLHRRQPRRKQFYRKQSYRHLFALFGVFLVPAAPIIGLTWWQMQGPLRRHALFAAIQRDDAPAVIALLHAGADPNARDISIQFTFWEGIGEAIKRAPDKPQGRTPLLAAFYSNKPLEQNPSQTTMITNPHPNPTIIRALLEAGADVEAKDEERYTPLTYAILADSTEVAALCLQHGASLKQNADNATPLYIAASQGRTKMMQFLIDHGAKVNEDSSPGFSPLMATVLFARKPECVRLLLQNKADVNFKDTKGHTALWWAQHPMRRLKPSQIKRLPEIVTLLKQAGAK